MTVKFYKNKSDKMHMTKSISQIGNNITNAVIKENVSVTDPVFTLKAYSGFNPATANYCYIDELNRYYYITDITILTPDVYLISCHVDVLMSFKSDILDNTAVIARQQNLHDYYLNDGVFKTKAKSTFDIIKFPNGFTSNYYFLTVAGNSNI